ncbi:MAG TPA: hypothetical protein VFQ53_21875 [Kofleriaceae bacterium]|nr:hypothetical protein [Kofleriaceae bacterium]
MGWSHNRAQRWIAIGLSFTVVVYVTYGLDGAAMYLAAYLIECALSADSLLPLSLVLDANRVRDDARPRLFGWAIGIAIVSRAIVLAGGAYLARAYDDALYLFGGYLAYQAIRCLREDDVHAEVDGFVDRWVRHVRAMRSPAAACLLQIAYVESIYAFDSLAALSISSVLLIVITANILATLATRGPGVLTRIRPSRAVIAALLLLTGAKLLAHAYLDVPPLIMLALVATIIGAGVIATTLAPRNPRNP